MCIVKRHLGATRRAGVWAACWAMLRSRVVLDRSKREFGCRSPGRAVTEPDHNQTQSSDLSGDISFWVPSALRAGAKICLALSRALGSALRKSQLRRALLW